MLRYMALLLAVSTSLVASHTSGPPCPLLASALPPLQCSVLVVYCKSGYNQDNAMCLSGAHRQNL